jgi:hypothetical protein
MVSAFVRVAVGVTILAAAAVAHAQPAGAQAETLFREGRDLMAAGKYAEACTAFETSQKLDPAVTTLLNLAGCREKNGQIATAWGLFLEAERQTRSATDDAAQKLHDVAQSRAAKLEARVSKLTINVSADSRVDRLEILRGGDKVEEAMWNRALPIDGGTYTITARAPGATAWSSQITVGAEADTKTIEVPKLQTMAGPVVKASEPAPAPETGRSNVVPLAVGGGAVALLGGALVFDLWGDSTYDQAKAEMTSQARRDSLYDSANTKRYLAQGFAVAGLAAGGVAVWLYLRKDSNGTSTAQRALVPTPSGIALVGSY